MSLVEDYFAALTQRYAKPIYWGCHNIDYYNERETPYDVTRIREHIGPEQTMVFNAMLALFYAGEALKAGTEACDKSPLYIWDKGRTDVITGPLEDRLIIDHADNTIKHSSEFSGTKLLIAPRERPPRGAPVLDPVMSDGAVCPGAMVIEQLHSAHAYEYVLRMARKYCKDDCPQ